MKYEHIKYETLLEKVLDRVDDKYDKRESSIIFNAIAPAVVEIAHLYMELDIILMETFGDTASRDYLIRRAAERGITPYPATYSIVEGSFTPIDLEVPLGSRFSIDELTYTTIEKLSDGQYKLECDQLGSIGNDVSGTLIPIDYIEDLETATLTELLIPGEDEEDTESIRERYFSTFDSTAYGGNQKDYIQKTNAIPGVGSTKVTPVWNGGGTVKLTILNSNYNKASTTLINEVQKIIDPNQVGDGLGVAPIDHIVTVDSVTSIPINIQLNLTFDDGFSFQTLESTIEQVVNEYLLELRKEWSNQTFITIRVAQLDTRILQTEGVIDISNTRINGMNENFELGRYDIPELGDITHD